MTLNKNKFNWPNFSQSQEQYIAAMIFVRQIIAIIYEHTMFSIPLSLNKGGNKGAINE